MLHGTISKPPIPAVLRQHTEESTLLRQVRSVLVRAPHVRLRHLRRLDDRIAAHLDGLSVAGAYGTKLCIEALNRPGCGECFAATARAVDERDAACLDRMQALAAVLPDARRGMLSALGWASAADLKGIVQPLLASTDAFRRDVALNICRVQRTDPGPFLRQALRDDDARIRASAIRTAGELGRVELRAQLHEGNADASPADVLHATCASVLLGAHHEFLNALETLACGAGPFRDAATQLVLLASPFARARSFVTRLAGHATPEIPLKRRVIRATALLGDTRYIPWLISLMTDDAFARLAGESFTLITGADLAALDLERKPPAEIPGGPNDDPNDDNVALDEDDSLPWPDQSRVQRWWHGHAAQMPVNERCFMGTAPTPEHCLHVLREGTQRQRFVAAQLRCLLAPGTPLFPVCAPAWRQQRLLAA